MSQSVGLHGEQLSACALPVADLPGEEFSTRALPVADLPGEELSACTLPVADFPVNSLIQGLDKYSRLGCEQRETLKLTSIPPIKLKKVFFLS